MTRWIVLTGAFVFLFQAQAHAQGVDPDIVRAAIGREALLERPDGAVYRGTVRGVTATAVILERKSGQLIKIPLRFIARVRMARTVRAPVVATPPPAYGGHGRYGRYGVRGGYARPNPVTNLKLQQTKEYYWSARRLRNAGMALFIVGSVLEVIGASMFAVEECHYDSYYDYCDVDEGAAIAGIALLSIGGFLDLIGIPMWIAGAVKTKVYWNQLQKLKAGQSVSDTMPRRSPFPVVARRSGHGRAFKLSYTFTF